MKKYTCPCCGYQTLKEEPPGTDEICKICFWHDDFVQYNYPDRRGGANHVSLREAQKNFQMFGVSEIEYMESVRQSNENDRRDPNWKPLD